MGEEQAEYITDAMKIMGAGYSDQPAAIIDPPRMVKALRDKGMGDYKVWGWVKKSTNFIYHIKILKGSKLAIWDVISLSIDEDGTCSLSAPEIAELTGYSVSEVRQSIGELDEMGYLSVIRATGKRSIYTPEFAARGANNPTDNPSRKSTPPVSKGNCADDPSSPSIENFTPSIKRVKRIKDVSSSNLQGIEASIYAGRPTTQEDINASNKDTWRGRELLGDNYLAYADWWHAKTGLHMYGAKAKAKVDTEWLNAFKAWYEFEITIPALDEAYQANEWRKVSKPSQITADAKLIQASPKKTDVNIPVQVDSLGIPETY